jgi:hypothetical protein
MEGSWVYFICFAVYKKGYDAPSLGNTEVTMRSKITNLEQITNIAKGISEKLALDKNTITIISYQFLRKES